MIEIQKCDGCDETGESREIPAVGHREGDRNVTTGATCAEEGERESASIRRITVNRRQLPHRFRLFVQTPLPYGKGMK